MFGEEMELFFVVLEVSYYRFFCYSNSTLRIKLLRMEQVFFYVCSCDFVLIMYPLHSHHNLGVEERCQFGR